jgi:hypothetical protein
MSRPRKVRGASQRPGRAPDELTVEREYLEHLDASFRTERPSYSDSYEPVILAVTSNTPKTLDQLLLELDVRTGDDLLHLIRTVGISTTVEVLRWAGDEMVTTAHLHLVASIAHPHAVALHHPDVADDPWGYRASHPELYA